MADPEHIPVHEAARLEAALERIARAGPRAARDGCAEASRVELTRRLDALIAELRQVLGRHSAD